VLFRSVSISSAGTYLSAMFGFGATGFIDETFWLYFSNGKWFLLAGILLSTPLFSVCRKKLNIRTVAYQIVSSLSLLAIFVFSLLNCIKSTYNPFIYFNF
jgi:alginate O-acetyltransferase complex protein AlgI